MSTEFAAVAARDAPGPAPLAAPAGAGRALLTLARRELWEHRALWIAPLVVAVLVVLCAIPAHVNVDDSDLKGFGDSSTARARTSLFILLQWMLSLPLYVVMLVVITFYLLDCLYTERKDRSILFWKSLPVSDSLTVLSKLFIALLIVPLGVFALATAAHLAFLGIWNVRAQLGYATAHLLSWDSTAWWKLESAMLLGLLLSALWYAPFAAYLLLVSAWARRSPFLWAVLPVVAAPLLERIAFGTHYLANLLAYRTFGIWATVFDAPHQAFHRSGVHAPDAVLDKVSFGAAFANIDVWLGVLVGAAMVYGAIRLRRYRDDT